MAVNTINPIGFGLSTTTSALFPTFSNLGLSQTISQLSASLLSPLINSSTEQELAALSAQIQQNDAGQVNVGDAVSFTQTQSGFLQEVNSALDQLSSLSVQAQDPTLSPSDLSNINTEFTQLQSFVSSVGSQTFNSVNLFSSGGIGVALGNSSTSLPLGGVDLSGAVSSVVAPTTSLATTVAAASASSVIATAIQNLSTLSATVGSNLQTLNIANQSLSVFGLSLQSFGTDLIPPFGFSSSFNQLA